MEMSLYCICRSQPICQYVNVSRTVKWLDVIPNRHLQIL
jgi:hypothetical protein